MRFTLSTSVLALAHLASAQTTSETSLSTALGKYSELSVFNSLLTVVPGLLGQVLDGNEDGVTLIVPTNDAIATFLVKSKIGSLSDLPQDTLKAALRYHVLDAKLKADDFSAARGVTVPTRLRDALYNNRTAGIALLNKYGTGATGQVLHISRDPIKTGKFKVRQVTGPTSNIRAGLAETASLTAIDGTWGANNQNYFQVVDRVLSPPVPCSTTIKSISDKLKSLDNALERTQLYPALDTSPNVTCLAPTTQAFAAAGNADSTLDVETLKGALLFHTLPSVTYTDFLEDGQEFTSLANLKVRVSIKNGEIYFNNAKVIGYNVLTNNGLLHILDSVMLPLNETTNPSTSSTTGTPSPTQTPGAANSLSKSGAGLAVALMAGLAMI